VPNAALNIGFFTRGYQWFQSVTTDTNGNYNTFNPPPGLAGRLLCGPPTRWWWTLSIKHHYIFAVYATPSSEDIEMSKNGTVSFQFS